MPTTSHNKYLREVLADIYETRVNTDQEKINNIMKYIVVPRIIYYW